MAAHICGAAHELSTGLEAAGLSHVAPRLAWIAHAAKHVSSGMQECVQPPACTVCGDLRSCYCLYPGIDYAAWTYDDDSDSASAGVVCGVGNHAPAARTVCTVCPAGQNDGVGNT